MRANGHPQGINYIGAAGKANVAGKGQLLGIIKLPDIIKMA